MGTNFFSHCVLQHRCKNKTKHVFFNTKPQGVGKQTAQKKNFLSFRFATHLAIFFLLHLFLPLLFLCFPPKEKIKGKEHFWNSNTKVLSVSCFFGRLDDTLRTLFQTNCVALV